MQNPRNQEVPVAMEAVLCFPPTNATCTSTPRRVRKDPEWPPFSPDWPTMTMPSRQPPRTVTHRHRPPRKPIWASPQESISPVFRTFLAS